VFLSIADGRHTQTGLAACYSIDEYERDLIKKHERTRRDKEDDRTRHIEALRAQTGPVFLTYRASRAIDTVAEKVTAGAALFDFDAADGVHHSVWPVAGADLAALITAFGELPCLYIADGHHRAASAARTRKHLPKRNLGFRARKPTGCLPLAFPDNQTQILPYKSGCSGFGRTDSRSAFGAAEGALSSERGKPEPAAKGEVSVYLAGRWPRVAAPDSGACRQYRQHAGRQPSP